MVVSKEGNELQSHPIIVWQGSAITDNDAIFIIQAEGQVIAKTSSMVMAFTLLFTTYYVFHVAYPDRCKSTLTFFQKAVLNLQDKVKKDIKVAGLLTKLYRMS